MNLKHQWDFIKPWLQLFHIPKIGNQTFYKLIDYYGDAESVVSQSLANLASIIHRDLAKCIVNVNKDPIITKKLQRDYDWLSSDDNHSIICSASAEYPHLLKAIFSPPPILYLKGNVSLLNERKLLAMVGSRTPTHHGSELAFKIGLELATHGMTIVSGMAQGIDGASHYGALGASDRYGNKGKTIAVVGTGIDKIYPKKHLVLEQEIATHGIVISEFPLGASPKPNHFPRRNRIISGLSTAVVVVEADVKSGSLVTARLAIEQGRDVMAFPGSVDNPKARGCHALIRQGAVLVESAQQIIEELENPVGLQLPLNVESLREKNTRQIDNQYQTPSKTLSVEKAKKSNQSVDYDLLAQDAKELLGCFGFEVVQYDELVMRSGFTCAKVSELLSELECFNYIKSVSGGFVRN